MKIDDDLLPDERALLEGKTPSQDEPTAATAAESAEEPSGEAVAAAPAQAEDESTEGEKTAEAANGEEALDVEALSAVAADGNDADPELLQSPDADFKAERAKIVDKEADIDRRWSDGTLTDEERAAELAKVRDERDALLRQEVRAETIADLNRQAIKRAQDRKLDALRADGKERGIDYSGEEHAGAFDAAMSALRTQKANAKLSFNQLADKAHAMVLAMNGVSLTAKAGETTAEDAKAEQAVAAAPAPAPAPAPARPDPRKAVPPTLTGMPVAASAPVGNDFLTSLAGIDDPDAAEAALAALPKPQREAIMRSTITTTARR